MTLLEHGSKLPLTTSVRSKLQRVLKKFWNLRTKVTVEPYIVCYVLPSLLAGLAVQNLCMEKACKVNLDYDNETCTHIMRGETKHYQDQERQVQTLVTEMTAWSYPIQTAIPGILVLFMGAWSDRTGNRKMFMLFPILGKLVAAAGVMLSTYFFNELGMDETAVLDGLPPAVTGGRVAMTTAAYSYVSVVTTASERTSRLGFVTAAINLSRPVGMALSGITTHRLGYYGVFSVAAVCYLTGFLYILLRIKDEPKKEQDDSGIAGLFTTGDLVSTMLVAVRTRRGTIRLQIFLILCAYVFIVGPVLVENQVTYYFTRFKFKFTEVDFSLYLTYSFLLNFIGSLISIYLFTNRWQFNDCLIGIIAAVSRIMASVCYALAPTRTVYFFGPVLDVFSSSGATALRAIVSKVVETDEIGKAGSLIAIAEALVPVVYSPLYSKVYKQALNSDASIPGAFYLISAALAVPCIFIFVILYVLQKNHSEDGKSDCAAKEVTKC